MTWVLILIFSRENYRSLLSGRDIYLFHLYFTSIKSTQMQMIILFTVFIWYHKLKLATVWTGSIYTEGYKNIQNIYYKNHKAVIK